MKSLTILVTPVNAVGHVNACAGALSALTKRGHRVVFLVEDAWKGKLAKLGYEERLYSFPKPADETNPADGLAKVLLDMKILGDFSVWDKLLNMRRMFQEGPVYEEMKLYDGKIKKAIEDLKPDFVYFDGGYLYPAIYYSGVKWINNVSAGPISFIFSDEVPPGCSGWSIDGSREKWAEFNELRRDLFFGSSFNELVEQLGYPKYPEEHLQPVTQSLTVYGYPEELNYPYIRTLGWFNLEVFNKHPDSGENLESLIPVEFVRNTLGGKFSGKLIYISMGSMGGADVDLMSRIVKALEETDHKCIVSKGQRHEEYSLPDNMWGDRFLPQTRILPHVDLVITHGGNNTTTETFAQGKPMIVLPLFGDQFDNAQRLQETGFGARLEPYKFTAEELVQAVDRLIYNEELKKKLANASTRILNSRSHADLADRIEQIFVEN